MKTTPQARKASPPPLKVYSKNPNRCGEKITVDEFVKEIIEDRIETLIFNLKKDAEFAGNIKQVRDEINLKLIRYIKKLEAVTK